MTGRSKAVEVTRNRANLRETVADRVAIEEPLEIRLGFQVDGRRETHNISITMRTPGDDEILAAGFLFTEGIVRARDDIAIVKPCQGENTVRVELEDGVPVALDQLERHFYTTSSCGVCGKTSLDALRVQGCNALDTASFAMHKDTLTAIPDRLRDAQATFEETGGLHAAAAFDSSGKLLVVKEDVGRHNAVDKVIGQLLLDHRLPGTELGMMVSGRAGFELVQKTLVAGIPMMAAVGAPTSLAVELAREFNMTLVGFLRGESFNSYAAGERIRT